MVIWRSDRGGSNEGRSSQIGGNGERVGRERVERRAGEYGDLTVRGERIGEIRRHPCWYYKIECTTRE